MTEPLTEAQAAEMRAQLAAHDYAQKLAAVQVENARRAEALTGLGPVTDAVADLTGPIEVLRALIPALSSTSLDLANLAHSTIRCADSLKSRLDRTTADLQPAPEPEPPADPVA